MGIRQERMFGCRGAENAYTRSADGGGITAWEAVIEPARLLNVTGMMDEVSERVEYVT